MKNFSQSGVSIKYPGSWTLEREDVEDGWTVTLNSPDMAFLLLSLMPHVDDIAHVADEALNSLRADYPKLEARQYIGSIAALPCTGYDVDFFTIDQLVSCKIRVVMAVQGALLILLQCSDYDREKSEPIMDEMLQTLQLED